MRYELLFQPREPGTPFDPGPLEAVLAARPGVTRRADGVWQWKLEGGELELARVIEGGVVVAMDLKVPFDDRESLVRKAFAAALDLAEAANVRVVDPSLNKTLKIEDEAAVLESFMRAARYAGEYMGVGSAIGASFTPREEDQGLRPGTRIALALVVFGLCAFLAWRLLVG